MFWDVVILIFLSLDCSSIQSYRSLKLAENDLLEDDVPEFKDPEFNEDDNSETPPTDIVAYK
jgi:hypothetical protein|tara:strand:+ start:222 stop:407 length:186 start_codon:yes stop_codon:yes gene_type:complete